MNSTLHRATGCEACNGTGFKGRVPLHELSRGTEDVKTLIQSKAGLAGLREPAIKEGMGTLIQDGIQKALQGLTTCRHVRAVAMKVARSQVLLLVIFKPSQPCILHQLSKRLPIDHI